MAATKRKADTESLLDRKRAEVNDLRLQVTQAVNQRLADQAAAQEALDLAQVESEIERLREVLAREQAAGKQAETASSPTEKEAS